MRKILSVLAVVVLASCGGGGGGSDNGTSTGDLLLGNFYFYYTIISDWDTKVTIDAKTDNKTDEGEDLYSGHNPDLPSRLAVGAWYPAANRYIIVAETSLTSMTRGYAFLIDGDNHLHGEYYQIINGVVGTPYALNSDQSRKYSSGSWSRTQARMGDKRASGLRELAEVESLGEGEADIDTDTLRALRELTERLN